MDIFYQEPIWKKALNAAAIINAQLRGKKKNRPEGTIEITEEKPAKPAGKAVTETVKPVNKTVKPETKSGKPVTKTEKSEFGNTKADKELAIIRSMSLSSPSANEEAAKLRQELPDYENTPADCLGSTDREYQEYKKALGK